MDDKPPEVIGFILPRLPFMKQNVITVFAGRLITFGSNPESDVVIKHCAISHLHCAVYTIKIDGFEYLPCIKDYSEYGTFINRHPIGQGRSTALFPGCTFTIGVPEFTFVFKPPQDNNILYLPTSPEWTYMDNEDDSAIVIMKGHRIGSGADGNVYMAVPCFKPSLTLVCKCKDRRSYVSLKSDRWVTELEIMKQFKHPNVVRLVHFVKTDNQCQMFSQLAFGGNLANYILKHNDMDDKRIRFIFYQLLAGIEYIHSFDVIHGDLKLENILLCEPEAYPRVIITDFGSAVWKKDANILTEYGTVGYHAPEIVSYQPGDQITEKVDMWSLGIVLYYMAVGKHPFTSQNSPHDDNGKEFTNAVLHDPPYYPDFLPIPIRLLAKDPMKRASSKALLLTTPNIFKEGSRLHQIYKKYLRYFDDDEKVWARCEPLRRIASCNERDKHEIKNHPFDFITLNVDQKHDFAKGAIKNNVKCLVPDQENAMIRKRKAVAPPSPVRTQLLDMNME